ncbi:MAG TPA: VOC family protein [Gaiellaceae bacterium]|nr:VOC family protein [Gaiellaceae bacterium]
MARVLGVGGVFFRARDPRALGEWYRRWLGVPVAFPRGASFDPESLPANAATVWAPFEEETSYLAPDRSFMFNLIVDDLDGALAQVVDGGATLADPIEEHEYGRFGWFVDPEGNKVELWQPPEAPPA